MITVHIEETKKAASPSAADLEALKSRIIAQTPVTVIDFETTGLNAGSDRVVEIAAVRLDPDREPELALNTLVNPQRRMAATEIHGITEEDIKDAPRFEDVAASLLTAISGSVIASYNVYFDIRFLDYELGRLGITGNPPYVCLMYLRPLLGLGRKCSLDEACRAHDIIRTRGHQAAIDALTGVALWNVYLQTMAANGILSFHDLRALAQYKFLDSLTSRPYSPRDAASLRVGTTQKSRAIPITAVASVGQEGSARFSVDAAPTEALRAYWEALKVVLVDLEITKDEVESLNALQGDLRLTKPQIRALHGKAFAELLSRTVEDRVLDETEAGELRRLHTCLASLGWAPGQ